jgi:hypothetical protein
MSRIDSGSGFLAIWTSLDAGTVRAPVIGKIEQARMEVTGQRVIVPRPPGHAVLAVTYNL